VRKKYEGPCGRGTILFGNYGKIPSGVGQRTVMEEGLPYLPEKGWPQEYTPVPVAGSVFVLGLDRNQFPFPEAHKEKAALCLRAAKYAKKTLVISILKKSLKEEEVQKRESFFSLFRKEFAPSLYLKLRVPSHLEGSY